MNKQDKPQVDRLLYEKQAIAQGHNLIAGIDEVGRGPLAGPVVVACAIMRLQPEYIVAGVNDSKQLSEKKREQLYPQIIQNAIAYSIVEVQADTIDKINILNATKLAMRQSLEQIATKPDLVLIDAVALDCDYPVLPIIKGDALSYTIGCASILAKVYRDRLMVRYAEQYPQYGFEKHKGYGTAAHIAALKQYGPCPLHRRSFIGHFVAVHDE